MTLMEKINSNYYTTKLPYGETAESRSACRDDQRRLEREFEADALRKLGLGDHPKAGLLYDKSWELGHSSGFSEVWNYMQDLAELVR